MPFSDASYVARYETGTCRLGNTDTADHYGIEASETNTLDDPIQ